MGLQLMTNLHSQEKVINCQCLVAIADALKMFERGGKSDKHSFQTSEPIFFHLRMLNVFDLMCSLAVALRNTNNRCSCKARVQTSNHWCVYRMQQPTWTNNLLYGYHYFRICSCTFRKILTLYMSQAMLIKFHRAVCELSLIWTLNPEDSSWEQKQWPDVLVGPIADVFGKMGQLVPRN